jgi:uncharacterized protein YlzI (FlbEa/FlbD family)
MFFKRKKSNFIKVTTENGTLVYLRKDYISSFFKLLDSNKTRIILENDTNWTVSESVEELILKLEDDF